MNTHVNNVFIVSCSNLLFMIQDDKKILIYKFFSKVIVYLEMERVIKKFKANKFQTYSYQKYIHRKYNDSNTQLILL